MKKTSCILAAICAALFGGSAAFGGSFDGVNYNMPPNGVMSAARPTASYGGGETTYTGHSASRYSYAPYAGQIGEEAAYNAPYETTYDAGTIYAGEPVEQKWISGSMVGSWYDGFLRPEGAHPANLNQVWLTGEKKIDTSLNPWDIGGRVDALFGTTNAQCSDGGFDGKWGVSDDGYAGSLYQAYAEVGWGILSAKVGKFGTIIGYEPVDNVPCALNTHTYMFAHEPATHTGALFTLAPGDQLSFNVGLTTGVDNSFENYFGDTGFLFGATIKPAENLSLSYASGLNQVHANNMGSFSWGYFELGGDQVGDMNEYLQTVTLETDLTDRFGIVLTTNYGTMEDRAAKIQRYQQIGAAGYLKYKFTDRLDGYARYEYYTQELVQEKVEGTYHDVGFSLYYRPTEHVFLRPDARYDWVKVGDKNDGFTGAVAFGLTF